MIKSDSPNRKSVLVEPDVARKPSVNWTVAQPENSEKKTPQTLETAVSFDQLLQICLTTLNQEMRVPLELIMQTIESLEETGLGSMTDEQLGALAATLRQQAQALGQMIDSLMYIAAYSNKK